MALTVTAGARRDSDADTTDVWSFDAGASPQGIFLLVASNDYFDPIGTVTYGGKSLTKLADGRWSTSGHHVGIIFGYVGNDVPSGSNDVSVVTGGATTRSLMPVAVDCDGILEVLDTVEYGDAAATVAVTMDSGSAVSRILVAGSVRDTGGTLSPLANTTGATRGGIGYQHGVGYESDDDTGSRTVGFSGVTWLCGRAGVLISEAAIEFTPRFGAEAGFHEPTLEVGADTLLTVVRFGAEAGFRPGLSFRTAGRRQIMLTGSGIETPEMTTGGTSGQVLVFNELGAPEWVDSAAGDITTDPAWAAKGDLIVGTGNDAAGILGAGSNTQVLTVDSSTATGLKWAAAGTPDLSAAVLDDIGDVDAAAPDDGDVLTWSDGDSAWVAAPASGGGAFDALGRLWYPASGATAADEFDDGSYASWTRLDKSSSSHLTVTEAAGVLSFSHTADACNGIGHALMMALPGSPTYPLTVEAAVLVFGQQSSAGIAVGPVLSDGVNTAAGTQVWACPHQYSDWVGVRNSIRRYSTWSTQDAESNGIIFGANASPFHVRLRWTGTNAFACEVSPDGVSWTNTLTSTPSLTPTHFGIGFGTFGKAVLSIATAYYVRVY